MDILVQQDERIEPREVEITAEVQEEKRSWLTKKVSTSLGYTLIVFFAMLAYSCVFWYADSYKEPWVVDWSDVVRQLQERRVVIGETPEVEDRQVLFGYDIREDGVYLDGEIIEGFDPANCTADNLEGCRANE